MSSYLITDQVKRRLAASFIEERDLIDSIREQPEARQTKVPGVFGLSFLMTVRRSMDLETAELRRIEVRMRSATGGFEVFQVDGLPEP